MSDDSFTHDADRFGPAAETGGVEIADAEARYANLFAAALWRGITPGQRQELAQAASSLGIPRERVEQLEQALTAAHDAQYYRAEDELIDEESSNWDDDTMVHSVAPLAPSEDPRIVALQKRIGVLEEQAYYQEQRRAQQAEHVAGLERLVEQLQFALESTLEELDDTGKELERLRVRPSRARSDEESPLSQSGPASATGSSVTGPTAPPSSVGVPASSRMGERWPDLADAAPSSIVLGAGGPAAEKSGAYSQPTAEDELWEADTFVTAAPRASSQRENPAVLHGHLRESPRDPALLHKLFRSLGRGEDLDRRWCIAHVLSFLGEADDAEREIHDKHARSGLVRPTRAINDDEWRELLFHPSEDVLTGEILAAIAPAVLLGHMTAMRASISPEVLDPSTRVEPKRSTLQAVRCIAWAAEFLGLKTPPLFVTPDHRGTAEIVLNPTPSTRLGKEAVSGRSTQELAFIAGRHLSWYRREHLLGKPKPPIRRLEDMFLAALMIGNPGLPVTADIKKRVEPLARQIRPLLDATAVEMLELGFTRFVALGGRTNLKRWYRYAERTAACAGMLLCNDMRAAHAMLQLEEPSSAEAALDELIVFFTAGRCTLLRKRIGIAVT